MKKRFLFIYFILSTALLNAQQIGLYSHFFYKPMLYNPAFAGNAGNINAMAINRTQFSGFTGAPQSSVFTLDGKIPSKKIGLGLTVTSDKQGLTGRIGGNLLYSYTMTIINKYTHLSFGVSLGAANYSFNYSQAIVQNNNDPLLSAGSQNKIAINGNFGIALFGKHYEFGISTPQIIGPKIKYGDELNTNVYYQPAPQYIGYYKYKYFISPEKKISLSPVALINYTANTPIQWDIGATFNWKNKFWIGTIYKNGYAVSGIAGFRLYKRLDLGYSYDFVTGSISKYSGIANEVMLSYSFGKETNDEKQARLDSLMNAKMKDLNSLLLSKILEEIDSLFENPNATKADYRALQEKIAQFTGSHFEDPAMKRLLREYARKLENGTGVDEQVDVTVKGQIKLPGKKTKFLGDFSGIKITLIDKETGIEIGIYSPKVRNGKYILVLKPGIKYIVKVERDGFQTFTKDMSPAKKKKSYEIKQSIALKKMKVVKAKPGVKK